MCREHRWALLVAHSASYSKGCSTATGVAEQLAPGLGAWRLEREPRALRRTLLDVLRMLDDRSTKEDGARTSGVDIGWRPGMPNPSTTTITRDDHKPHTFLMTCERV